jgi:hypothetical protein
MDMFVMKYYESLSSLFRTRQFFLAQNVNFYPEVDQAGPADGGSYPHFSSGIFKNFAQFLSARS